MIITVKQGNTIYSLSRLYSLPVSKIISDNGIKNETIVVGQSLIIDIPDDFLIAEQTTTVKNISQALDITQRSLFQNNYFLSGRQDIKKGDYVVLSYKTLPQQEKIIGGYAYSFISQQILFSVMNYLTYIIPFTYGFTKEGELISLETYGILKEAQNSGTGALMHISTLTDEGYFDNTLPHFIFTDETARRRLINNIISEIIEKGYDGADIDFEFLTAEQKEDYIAFTKELYNSLHDIGKILVIAVPPMNSKEQRGILFDGIDYESLGQNADYIMIMAYEYGYKFGPPLAIAPVNQIVRVLDYAISVIPNEKILLGVANYGYDWTLPYIRGESDAPSISTVEAIELAKRYGAEIMFDEIAMAPYFFYTDSDNKAHEVWFEDARSIAAKMNLIKEYNLAGGFIWDLMRENPQAYVTINSEVKIHQTS